MSAVQTLAVLNLRRLLMLRGIAIGGWLLVLAFMLWRLDVELQVRPVIAVLGGWILISVVSWLWLRHREEIPDGGFILQLLIDIGALTVLLYLTGGSTNPLILLLLLPLTVSAALLPGVYTWSVALITMLCYTLLLYVYIPLTFPDHAHKAEFDIHIIGMWLGFVLSAGLIATFVAKMGNTLRERDHALAQTKERALRDERIVALGTLAAGAAHELGTPLGTIALLVEEIENEHADGDPALAEKARILRTQVHRCKSTLNMLSMSAGQSQAASGHSLPLDRYLEETVSQWKSARHEVGVVCTVRGERPAPVIVTEQTLSQALISIFNNAADASRDGVEIDAYWDKASLHLDVLDRGPGVTPAVISAAGKSFISTKRPDEGLGLGLYLAYSVIDRLGGHVRLFNREGGGACTRVTLPLRALLVHASRDDMKENLSYESGHITAGR